VQRERDEAVVIAVGQLSFGLCPDELIGIELRRVTRKAVHFQPGMSLEKDLNVPTPMNLPAIPEQNERSPKMVEQLAEERDDLSTGDVAHVEIEVQTQTAATRGHGERRDDGDFVPSVAMPEMRRAADGRPGLANIGDEQEAALIEKREMCAPPRGVFLSAAIRPASTEQWLLHSAGAHDAPASASSSPYRAAIGPTRRPGCIALGSACE
jgi:hypothetical protein